MWGGARQFNRISKDYESRQTQSPTMKKRGSANLVGVTENALSFLSAFVPKRGHNMQTVRLRYTNRIKISPRDKKREKYSKCFVRKCRCLVGDTRLECPIEDSNLRLGCRQCNAGVGERTRLRVLFFDKNGGVLLRDFGSHTVLVTCQLVAEDAGC